MNLQQYFKSIRSEVDKYYKIANAARKKGFDPVDKVETPIAISLAERSVGLISVVYPQFGADKKVVNRILDLEKEYGQLDICVSLKIAEEIAREKFCKFENLLEAMDAGIRVGFSYFTLGVVSSPIEGYTGIKLGKTKEGKEYIKAYFSGPIRSAGTTASCVVLMIIDYLRERFGFSRYDPTSDEVKRYVTENYDYHERVTNLQYLPTEEEVVFLAERLPIQIAGEPTEQREVSNYKDLPRVESNFIRGGMCLMFSEGLAQKAAKGFRLLKGAKERGFESTGWDYLSEFVGLQKRKQSKGETDSSPVYIRDIVAGRPVLGHPGESGSLRFRYGRCRTNGFSAAAIHPATMAITDSFISTGTQLKIEKPTKGCAVAVCDSIDGPTIKTHNGDVRKIDSFEEAKRIYKEVEEIIYLGDILIPLGDVINRNYDLLRPGYVQEWWGLELEKALKNSRTDPFNIDITKAFSISREHGIPLHPDFIFYWSQISYEEFLSLLDWIGHGEISYGKLILPYSSHDRERFARGKRALELIGCEHSVSIENVVLEKNTSTALMVNLGIKSEKFAESLEEIFRKIPKGGRTLEIVNLVSDFKIKDKAGDFIGARMGKPEKAKLRKLTGSPHVLFPVGSEGGRLRSFQAACDKGLVSAEFPNFYCRNCERHEIYPKCSLCGEYCEKKEYCFKCEKYIFGKCEIHGSGTSFSKKRIDIKNYFDFAKKMTKTRLEELPAAVKGVRGTSNEGHECENIGKGLIRAKYNLNVNKDGTIRYDMTELPLTHFKPKEIGTSVKKLIDLGYVKDIKGKELKSEDQLLELFPHDIILPSCPSSLYEKAEDVFLRVSRFLDDELQFLYDMERNFNYKVKDDLIGSLFACIAPHICTAVVGRLIGFSKTQGFLASPYMHAAMRRDADGDEAAAIFLLDMLINFSRRFLPAHRGGTQDSPLVLNSKINAGEVDDQILDFDVGKYGLELYESAEQRKHSSEVSLETIGGRLRRGENPFVNLECTHECFDINSGTLNSAYKLLPTMQEKVSSTMNLCRKIRAVNTSDVARLIIERHFIRDIRGNLRKFSMQSFRCVGCNEKFRRVPLSGRCTKCSGKIIFTISEGSIVKYLAGALELARKYNVGPYLVENLEIVERNIQDIFGREKERQENLNKWF